MRIFLVLLALLSLPMLACRAPCAHGPGYIEKKSHTATPGQPVDIRLPLDAKGDGTGALLHYASAQDMPAGLTAAIDGSDLRLTGSVAQVGSYQFTVLLQEIDGDACAAWARYDLTLDVAN